MLLFCATFLVGIKFTKLKIILFLTKNLNIFNPKIVNKLFSDSRSGCRVHKSTHHGSGSATLPSAFRSSLCAKGGSRSEIFL
jgi:hypothetical protein